MRVYFKIKLMYLQGEFLTKYFCFIFWSMLKEKGLSISTLNELRN